MLLGLSSRIGKERRCFTSFNSCRPPLWSPVSILVPGRMLGLGEKHSGSLTAHRTFSLMSGLVGGDEASFLQLQHQK